MDLRPPLESAMGAFSLAAVVTPPDGDPVETEAFWLPPTTVEVPVGAELRRAEERRVLVLPKSDVPQVPRGTIIAIPEYEGAATSEWRVDSMEGVHHDHHRVVVVLHEQQT